MGGSSGKDCLRFAELAINLFEPCEETGYGPRTDRDMRPGFKLKITLLGIVTVVLFEGAFDLLPDRGGERGNHQVAKEPGSRKAALKSCPKTGTTHTVHKCMTS